MSSWLASFFATLSYYLGYQPVDEQTLFVKEQEPETESEEIIDDLTMEKSDAKLVKKGKTLLGDLHTDLEKLNKNGRMWNQWASDTDEAVRNEIQLNLTNLDSPNLMIIRKLSRVMVLLDNINKSESSRLSKSKFRHQEMTEAQQRENQQLKEEEKKIEIEKHQLLEAAEKRQQQYFENISSASQDFFKKLNEQSRLGVGRLKPYKQEVIEELDKEAKNFTTKNPRDVEVSQKASNVLSEKMDGNSSKMDINTIVLRRTPDICSQLVLKPSVTADEIRNEIQILEVQHQNKMNLMKLESAENLKKSEMEFREKLAKEEEENEKELWELDREIEEFERETKRIIEEKLLEIRKMNLAVFQCVLLQRKWEMEEKEFDKYLDSIREPISRLKTRYSLFKKVLKTLKRNKNQVLKRELTSLHGSTYYAYQSVYEGWENVKKLSETFSDRIFLFILLKTLVNVSDKLFNILSCIDYFMNQTGSLENIREEFSKLDTMDIPQTWKLRDQSEIEPLDTLNFKGSPRFYEFPTNVRITEV